MKASRVIRSDLTFADLVNQKIVFEHEKGNFRFSSTDATKFFARKIKSGGSFTILHDL